MQRLNQQGFRKTGCLTAQHHATAPFASPRSPAVAAAAGAPAYGRPQSARPQFARYGAAPTAAAAAAAALSADDDELSVQGSAVSPVKAAAVPLPPRVRPASAHAPRSTAAATLPANGWTSMRTPSMTGSTTTASVGARPSAANSAHQPATAAAQHEWSDEEESIGESPLWQSDSPTGAERSSSNSPAYKQQQQQQQQQLQEVEDAEWGVTMANTSANTSAGAVNKGARGCRGAAANPLLDPYRTTGGLALEYTAQSRRREVQFQPLTNRCRTVVKLKTAILVMRMYVKLMSYVCSHTHCSVCLLRCRSRGRCVMLYRDVHS